MSLEDKQPIFAAAQGEYEQCVLLFTLHFGSSSKPPRPFQENATKDDNLVMNEEENRMGTPFPFSFLPSLNIYLPSIAFYMGRPANIIIIIIIVQNEWRMVAQQLFLIVLSFQKNGRNGSNKSASTVYPC